MTQVENIGHMSKNESIHISLEYANYRQALVARISKRSQIDSSTFNLMRNAWNEMLILNFVKNYCFN